uniref:Uncharacterized protein n=1 Tax=Romanomermis culicivorax TaxID=13658 RepID=A0A915IDR4_ROMCU
MTSYTARFEDRTYFGHSLIQKTINENNYNPFPGFGEKGKAVRLNGEDEIKSKDLFQINQFNLVASDRIALNRTLLDARKKACRE